MKPSFKILYLPVLMMLLSLGSCTIEVTENNTGKVSLEETDYLGCFVDNPADDLKSTSPYIDSLFYVIENDTLTLNVMKSYNCCGSLMDSVNIDEGKVDIFISDTCTYMCQCWCTCNFDFVYSFTDFWQKNTHFYVYLKGLGESSYQLWKETEFIDGLD